MTNLLFIHTCDIQRSTPTQNSEGELIDSWATLKTAVPCHFSYKSEREPNAGQSGQIATRGLLLFPAGTDVTTADRIANIKYEDGTTADAGPLDIFQVLKRRARGRQHHVSVRTEYIG